MAAVANELAINEAGTSKKLTVQLLQDFLGVIKKCITGSAHSNSTTTGTEVTALQITLPAAGTYTFKYSLIVRSSTAGTGIGLAINHTGTTTKVVTHYRYASTGGTAATGVMEDAVNAVGGQMHESQAARALATTVPNMVTGGVATTAADILTVVEGVIVVSAAGDLELWHSSETAAATTIEVGSAVVVTRVA